MRCELNYSAHTVASYSRDIRQMIEWLSPGNPEAFRPSELTSSDVRAWMGHLSSIGDSRRTLRRKLQAVRAFYRYLMLMGVTADNPAAEVSVKRPNNPLPVFFRQDEINACIDEAKAEDAASDDFTERRDNLVIAILYNTGMRRGELISLLDADVDTARGELKVLGKRNKERVIPFGRELASQIDDFRALRRELGLDNMPTLLTRPGGEPLYPRLVNMIVGRRLDGRVHAARISPHVLRHTFASDMLNNGADINAVRQLLGHTSLTATQIYTHISYRELKQNYELAHPRAIKKGG